MDPDLYQAFATSFTAEWNKAQAEAAGDLTARKSGLVRIKAQLDKLVDAICAGTPMAAIRDRMQTLEDRRTMLETDLAQAVAPAPRLHPNLPMLYRQRVAELSQALQEEGGDATGEAIRALVEEVRLVPEDGSLLIELRGELSAILGLAAGSGEIRPGCGREAAAQSLAVQVKMVAGTGFEPVTFRL